MKIWVMCRMKWETEGRRGKEGGGGGGRDKKNPFVQNHYCLMVNGKTVTQKSHI